MLVDAAVAHRKGDVATAKRLYRKVLKAQPSHFKALRLSGALAHETGDLDEAIKLLGAAVRHAPANETGALEDLGLLYLQTGELEKAERLLRRAVETDGTSLVALTRLGSTLITCGRASEAVEVLERARELDPSDPQITYALAHALLESSKFERAVEVADLAIGLRADDAAAMLVKGVALYQLDRFGESEAVLAEATKVTPDDANAWFHLGRARAKNGNADGAREALEKGVELAPGLASVCSELVGHYSGVGRYDDAIAAADRVLERQPTSAAPLLAKAFALRDAGRVAEADALVDLDALVVAEGIEAPPRFDDVAAFNAAVERMVLSHPSLEKVHTNRATRNGIQTGSLMIEPSREMRALARIIDLRVRALKHRWRSAGDAPHQWIQHAPSQWFVNAWAVVLGDGGHQVAHLHPEAWLSGVYYVALPADGMGPGHGEDGWLELGCPPEQAVCQTPPPIRRIEPRPGLLVTFPSFVPHRTIPFAAASARISIAFDVFPAD